MGRDNQPKQRQKRDLARKLNRRASYDRILIVSEGSKTEPNYFKEIRATYRLNTANVAVQPSGRGTEPIQVVRYAEELFLLGDSRKGIAPRAFEQVYAVFDRDDHRTYFDALRMAEGLGDRYRNDIKQPVVFRAVASVPCFELWLLLHYEEILHPIHRDEVMRRLKARVRGYEKGATGMFDITRGTLEQATRHAHGLAERGSAHDGNEPYTDVADLVERLIGFSTLKSG